MRRLVSDEPERGGGTRLDSDSVTVDWIRLAFDDERVERRVI